MPTYDSNDVLLLMASMHTILQRNSYIEDWGGNGYLRKLISTYVLHKFSPSKTNIRDSYPNLVESLKVCNCFFTSTNQHCLRYIVLNTGG